ncbi:hypothetical protein [Blastococcus tunisiensis]|uniref:Uncharacterized protein n=1 Tax=Blastococcus tunisiensis TaxID=1798228 RepID=A0A1I2B6W3_9ACTN|nr:hypothetical protein [Blastococcus sp. DSM 46838]SFE51648.1 hypothetical protein SAMN05216574_10466 [Blastococcus sp. DSM 46838]
MGGRKRGKYPYDYAPGDDVRFADSGAGGTLRVLHGPGRGMGVPDGVVCRVEVAAADGSFVDECHEGKLGKEHRLHGTSPGDRITVIVHGGFGDEQLTATLNVLLSGDLADVVRFGVGPAWELVRAIDTGDADPRDSTPDADAWGAGVRLRGARAAG